MGGSAGASKCTPSLMRSSAENVGYIRPGLHVQRLCQVNACRCSSRCGDVWRVSVRHDGHADLSVLSFDSTASNGNVIYSPYHGCGVFTLEAAWQLDSSTRSSAPSFCTWSTLANMYWWKWWWRLHLQFGFVMVVDAGGTWMTFAVQPYLRDGCGLQRVLWRWLHRLKH